MPGPLGRSVILPYYAREDLAYTTSDVFGTIPAGLVLAPRIPGDRFQIPLSVVYTVVTSAVVTQRVPLLVVQDQDGNTLYSIMANGYQVESQTMRHAFYVDAGSSYFAGATNSVTVLPYTLLLPGQRIFFQWSNVDSGDQLTGCTFTYQAIPTGPQRQAEPLIAPPLLV